MKIFYALLLFSLTCVACNNTQKSSGSETAAQAGTTDTLSGTTGSFYKRYGGSAGTRNIVLHLTQYAGGRVRDAFYYTLSDNRPIHLSATADTSSAHDYYFNEGPDCDRIWMLKNTANGVTGTITNTITGVAEQLKLEEAYPDGSYKLDAWYLQDTGRLFRDMMEPKATAAYGMVWPAAGWSAEESAFTRSRLTTAMRFEGAAGVAAGLKTRAFRYFSGYRNELRDVVDRAWPEAKRKDIAYHYSSTFFHHVLYNDRQWLVLEDAESIYTGGAHSSYSSSFHTLDMKGHREWPIEEVITDTAALKPYLELAVRDYFNIKSTEDLSSRLLTEAVPVTGNFYCTPAGLTLVYNPYELASYSDGPVHLFIPFGKIASLLTEDFKKRMELSAGSGVAMNIAADKAVARSHQFSAKKL